jgi:DNA repair protein RadC
MTRENPDNERFDYLSHRARLKSKFILSGLETLLDYEVLELLLSFSILRKDVKPLAKHLLREFGSIKGVMEASPCTRPFR